MLKTGLVSALVWLLGATVGQAQTATPFYRVFLADGRALTSFGEWARVEDRVVFSMPLSPAAGPADLHLVSLPLQQVDWPRTERYADAVRASQYAATRGEAEFAQLSSTVAATLNQVASLPDPKQRLAFAEGARRALADWPARHHNYRAAEVRDILAVLDEVISSLRTSAGQPPFDIALSATTEVPPNEPLLPAPDHKEVIEQLVAASEVVESPAEKVSLLQAVVALIDRAVAYVPSAIASAVRASAVGAIAEEQRIDEGYDRLRASALAEAAIYAERADVRSLERLRQQVRSEDQGLGARRPETVGGVLAALETHLDAAHRLRLAHDQWLLSAPRMREYRQAAWPYIQRLINRRDSLDDIKLLAGPAPQQFRPLLRDLERHGRLLALLEPPAQLVTVHASVRSAYSLALNAVQLRRDAVEHADVELAHQASAAASGALMLLERAREDLRAALEPPVTMRSVAGQ